MPQAQPPKQIGTEASPVSAARAQDAFFPGNVPACERRGLPPSSLETLGLSKAVLCPDRRFGTGLFHRVHCHSVDSQEEGQMCRAEGPVAVGPGGAPPPNAGAGALDAPASASRLAVPST